MQAMQETLLRSCLPLCLRPERLAPASFPKYGGPSLTPSARQPDRAVDFPERPVGSRSFCLRDYGRFHLRRRSGLPAVASSPAIRSGCPEDVRTICRRTRVCPACVSASHNTRPPMRPPGRGPPRRQEPRSRFCRGGVPGEGGRENPLGTGGIGCRSHWPRFVPRSGPSRCKRGFAEGRSRWDRLPAAGRQGRD